MKPNILVISPVVALFIGEILIYLGYPLYGMGIHIINLQFITLLIITEKKFLSVFEDQNIKPFLQALILLLLLRIINMAVPILFVHNIYWISIIYGIMFIPIYLLIIHQELNSKEMGLYCDKMYLIPLVYIPAALCIGIFLSWIEYLIIHPDPVISNLSISNLLVLIMIMFIIIPIVEELIFRSILQSRLEKILGMNHGLILASMLFGIMHSGYGMAGEIIFACLAGLLIGFIFQKTRCLPFIVIIHGTINVFVFGIFPLML